MKYSKPGPHMCGVRLLVLSSRDTQQRRTIGSSAASKLYQKQHPLTRRIQTREPHTCHTHTTHAHNSQIPTTYRTMNTERAHAQTAKGACMHPHMGKRSQYQPLSRNRPRSHFSRRCPHEAAWGSGVACVAGGIASRRGLQRCLESLLVVC